MMQPAQGKQLGPPIIECRDVHKWFGSFHVLRGCNLTVHEKEVVVIIGPSGSGKSTFIRCINRLEAHHRARGGLRGVLSTGAARHTDQWGGEGGVFLYFFFFSPPWPVLKSG